MATIQHPAFESDQLTVDDPAPWVEQGWILLPDQDAVAEPFDNGGTPPGAAEVTSDLDAAEVVDGTNEGAAAEVVAAPKPGPRGKK